MLQHCKSARADEKGSVTNIASILNMAIPLTFIFNKLNIIMTLCRNDKSGTNKCGDYKGLFQDKIIYIKVTK